MARNSVTDDDLLTYGQRLPTQEPQSDPTAESEADNNEKAPNYDTMTANAFRQHVEEESKAMRESVTPHSFDSALWTSLRDTNNGNSDRFREQWVAKCISWRIWSHCVNPQKIFGDIFKFLLDGIGPVAFFRSKIVRSPFHSALNHSS